MSIETYEYAIESVRNFFKDKIFKDNLKIFNAINFYRVNSILSIPYKESLEIKISDIKSYFESNIPKYVYYDSDIEGILEKDPDLSIMELKSRGIYRVNVWQVLLGSDLYEKVIKS